QNGRLDDLETGQTVQDGRLDDLETGQTVQNGRLDGIDTDQTTQNGRLDGIDTDQTTQNGRLDDVEVAAGLALLDLILSTVVIRDDSDEYIGVSNFSDLVMFDGGVYTRIAATRSGLSTTAQNTFNFESSDCTGQAYANAVGIFDDMNFEQSTFPLDSDNDGTAEWVAFPTGPAESVTIFSRLNAQGNCISVGGPTIDVSPMFLLDLDQFATPWNVR
ncbi:MAG: hypothetical protein GY778_28770, partial [bacterium]|nr:hypothetical protein [bacterium]